MAQTTEDIRRRDAHAAWSAIPDELRDLLGPDDDLNAVADSLQHLRLAGLNVTTAEMFRLAIAGARRKVAHPEPHRIRTYPAGEWQRRAERTSVVYYARLGNRVKIGYTTDLSKRMKVVNPEEVMATEPGGPHLEAARHQQFADLRTHGEWFVLDEPLAEHIRALQS